MRGIQVQNILNFGNIGVWRLVFAVTYGFEGEKCQPGLVGHRISFGWDGNGLQLGEPSVTLPSA